ncbi:MLO-like protein [Striga asiatica]|uniref:MLO-like protein n=1 Tax=Striga asiatica TaxID=4170 RepID=A0A5A7Q2A9_STRAF|nr:MLO-like protein [Striga asiatica]
MAGGEGETGRELDHTPTWAVSLTFVKRKKLALVDALEKIKAELMILGFISLLLTFGQNYITQICIPDKLSDTMLPCEFKEYHDDDVDLDHHHRRLMTWHQRRILAADSMPKDCPKGYVPLISTHGLHQLHIFIFFLAVFHVFYGAVTMMLGRLKIRGWKYWERQAIQENEVSNDPSRFRLTHETSFVKSHTNAWMQNPILFYVVCFFRHMLYSVQKPDYLTLRHGFVSVHLSSGMKFDFQKYIKRSLEDDFKVVVGIPPHLWMTSLIYLLVNVKGGEIMFFLSILPLVVILAVGTKLQSIITQMAIEIQEKHAVIQGIPLVQVSDRHFWFSKPTLVLHLIHLTLFLNAFEITYFIWITMGSHMKKSIFDEQTSKALMNWHNKVKKKTDSPKPHARKLGGSPRDSPENSPHGFSNAGEPSSVVEMGHRDPISHKDMTDIDLLS